ncbi:hypothetical protein JCM15519_10130 [Fundidesulfovibrio butyratiphilus]
MLGKDVDSSGIEAIRRFCSSDKTPAIALAKFRFSEGLPCTGYELRRRCRATCPAAFIALGLPKEKRQRREYILTWLMQRLSPANDLAELLDRNPDLFDESLRSVMSDAMPALGGVAFHRATNLHTEQAARYHARLLALTGPYTQQLADNPVSDWKPLHIEHLAGLIFLLGADIGPLAYPLRSVVIKACNALAQEQTHHVAPSVALTLLRALDKNPVLHPAGPRALPPELDGVLLEVQFALVQHALTVIRKLIRELPRAGRYTPPPPPARSRDLEPWDCLRLCKSLMYPYEIATLGSAELAPLDPAFPYRRETILAASLFPKDVREAQKWFEKNKSASGARPYLWRLKHHGTVLGRLCQMRAHAAHPEKKDINATRCIETASGIPGHLPEGEDLAYFARCQRRTLIDLIVFLGDELAHVSALPPAKPLSSLYLRVMAALLTVRREGEEMPEDDSETLFTGRHSTSMKFYRHVNEAVQKIRKQGRQPLPNIYSEENVWRGQPYDMPLVTLNSRNCRWLLQGGGCTTCNYNEVATARDNAVPPEELVKQTECAMHVLPASDYPFWTFSTAGSFFDDNEIPAPTRLEILRKLRDAGYQAMNFESRPEFCRDSDTLREVREAFGGEVSVGLGLESYSDTVRYTCLNKGYPTRVFEEAAQALHRAAFPFDCYVLLGKPFLGVDALTAEIDWGLHVAEAVETINYAFSQGAEFAILMVANMQPNTLSYALHRRTGLYQLPSLWLAVEVIAALKKQDRQRVLLKGLMRAMPHPLVHATTCPRCVGEYRRAHIAFNQGQPFQDTLLALRRNSACACRARFDEQMARSSIANGLPTRAELDALLETSLSNNVPGILDRFEQAPAQPSTQA